MRSDEDQKTATLNGILAEKIHKTPGKTLAGDDYNATAIPLPGPGKTLAEGINGATARPAPAKTPPTIPKQLLAMGGHYTNSTSTYVLACRSS